MPTTPSASEPFSPLLHILQKQIVPWVRESGMDNVIVAAPSWRKFQQGNRALPDGTYVTQQRLKSKRISVRANTKSSKSNQSLISARWPEDGLHATTTPVLCYVLAGSVALSLGDYAVHCLPGHAVLMPAGTPRPDGSLLCIDESRGNDYCSMLSFMPWAGGVECWVNHTQNGVHKSARNHGEHCHVLHAQATLYLESLAEEAVTNFPECRLLCNGLLSAFVAILVREIRLHRAFQPVFLGEASADSTVQLKLKDKNPIKRAQIYIDTHLHESPSIDRVASHVYMSRAYFTRQFRQVTGMTFTEYLTQCRLKNAKVLLINTNWSLQRISVSLGISPGRLRSIFLEYEKQKPADFRKNNRDGR